MANNAYISIELNASLGERCIEASDNGKRPKYSQIYFIDGIDCFIGT
jgi:hypothetical protein